LFKTSPKRVDRLVEEIKDDKKLLKSLREEKPRNRIKELINRKKEIKDLNNLKRNELFIKVNEFLKLKICSFLEVDLKIGEQFCNPDRVVYNSKINFSSDRLRSNCDLSRPCKKRREFNQ